jgi:beta propeller repeat protein
VIGPFGRACRLVVAGGAATAAMMLGCASTASADWLGKEHQLTVGAAAQDWPQLSGSRLAYADHTTERTVGQGTATETAFDIRVLDLKTGADVVLTPEHTALGRPAISGARVVWDDYGNGTNRGLWYRNLVTGQQRRLDASPGTRPQLSGDLLCYEYQGRIHVHSIGVGRDLAVSPDGGSASACDISGRVVVWQDVRNGHDADIYAYDLDSRSETRLTTTSTDQTLPRIDNGLVVWQDAVSATSSDIYAADLATGTVTQVTTDESVQWFADVADGRIVWMDERDGHNNTEIYLYDVAGGVTTRVSRHDGWSGNPTIAGNRIAYEDSRGAGHKVYLRTVTPPTLSLDSLPGAPTSPRVSGYLLGADGSPVTAESVVLETSLDGRSWSAGTTADTDLSGGFTLDVDTRSGDRLMRARFVGTPEYPGAVSRPITVERAHIVPGLSRPRP